MESRLLLDVVVGESATVFQLLAGEDQTLLIGRDAWQDKNKESDEKMEQEKKTNFFLKT